MGHHTKDNRDVYSRRSKDCEFRARSAYKLLQIDDEFHIFECGVKRVIDLCAAPGSWSQAIVSKLTGNYPSVVAVDLQEMAPIKNVECIQGDITREETLVKMRTKLGGKLADLVVCDGAPDVTGSHVIDEHLQLNLLLAALRVCLDTLKEGGTFISKFFRGDHAHSLVEMLSLFFNEVYTYKPPSSRELSLEAFVVCKNLRVPEDYAINIEAPLTEFLAYVNHKLLA